MFGGGQRCVVVSAGCWFDLVDLGLLVGLYLLVVIVGLVDYAFVSLWVWLGLFIVGLVLLCILFMLCALLCIVYCGVLLLVLVL